MFFNVVVKENVKRGFKNGVIIIVLMIIVILFVLRLIVVINDDRIVSIMKFDDNLYEWEIFW